MTEPTTQPQDAQIITRAVLIKYLSVFSVAIVLLAAAVGIVFGAVSGGLVSHFFPAQSVSKQTIKEEDSAIISAVKTANPAVVSIIISKAVPNIPQFNPLDPFGFLNNGQDNGSSQQEIGGGSGFIISSNGLIVTNKHVASDKTASYTVILSNGKRYDAKIVAVDPTNDISIVKINASGLPTLQLGESNDVELGQRVIAIGNALGQYANTVSVGVISGINRVVTASDSNGSSSETLHNVLQTDAQINPGNSGGPLLNVDGQVIGINTAVAQNAQGIGFAIPIDQAKSDISSVQASGTIVKPELGVRYQEIDSSFKASNPSIPYDYGAYVTSFGADQPGVVPGTPADKAGIQQGDIILEVNGTKVDQQNPLSTLIQNHNVGDTVTLKVYHQGAEKTVSVKLDKQFS